ncbi:hypothetical protein [Chryseobacterium sp. SIMBA_038]|uniref:hypothetical protein n=1 Tax=Chryseobacterium sp. SIMBA_038 TaxID=3085780 RepID=UPI00397C337A
MNYYKHWESCIDQIEKGQIENATLYALKIAVKLDVSQVLIDRIMSINLKSYEKKVEAQMDECLKRAKLENAEALCLYYNLDNGWDSTIYICKEYTDENSYWISKSRSWIEIGKTKGFSGIYKIDAQSAFFGDKISSGICILLMLRTTISFYNVAQKFSDCGMKICITATESDFVRVL